MKARILICLLLIVSLLAPTASYARWMNPSTGRFHTMDTFEGDQRNPQSLHKYTYAANNPVNNIDPAGRESIGDVMAVMNLMSSFMALGAPATARAGAGLGVGSSAGPDVTAAVLNTTLDVEHAFMPPHRGMRVAVNVASKVWTPAMANDGWDIAPLNELAHLGRPDFGNGSRLGTALGRETVQFSFMGQPTKAYYAGSVNYILWGKMFRMLSLFIHNPVTGASEFSEEMAVSTAWVHKALIGDPFNAYEKQALAFVRFGWSGTEDPSRTALPLAPNPANVGASARFPWKFLGVHDTVQ
jgi:hypothetical protein